MKKEINIMKKFISVALVAIIVFSLSVVAFAAKLGDVNGDGNVKASDALYILQSVAGQKTLTAQQKKLADCNKDGKVSAIDARVILQMVVGKVPMEEMTTEEQTTTKQPAIGDDGDEDRIGWDEL